MDREVPRLRHPWELHATACLLALAIGYGMSEHSPGFVWEKQVYVLFGVPVCLLGLIRGSPIAWWATTVAFVVLSIGGILGSGQLIVECGLRAHPMLLRAHAIAGLKYAFIVNENNTVFRRRLNDDLKASDRIPPGRLKKEGYLDWPDDPELKGRWDRLD